MKRMLFIIAMTMTLTLTGCGDTAENRQRTGATLEIDAGTAYVSERIAMKGSTVIPRACTENGIVVTYAAANRPDDYTMYLYQPEDDSFTEIHKNRPGCPAYVTELPDGRLAALYHIEQGKHARYYKYNETDRVMEIYGDDWNVEEEISLNSLTPNILHEDNIAMDGAGNWYQLAYDLEDGSWSLHVMNPDFSPKGTIDAPFGENIFARGKSGALYSFCRQGQDLGGMVYRYDADNLTAEKLPDSAVPNAVGIMDGAEYELYYYNNQGIFGLNADGSSVQVVDFWNSGYPCWQGKTYLNSNSRSMPDGEFVIGWSKAGDAADYFRLRPRSEEELAQTQIISLAGVNLGYPLVDDVCRYNKSQQEYIILMKDYGRDFAENSSMLVEVNGASGEYVYLPVNDDDKVRNPEAVKAFQSDLLAGTVPDIICLDGLPYQQLSNKGILTDLAPMLENDERFDPNDYCMNILDGMKKGDKLERIGFSFRFDTVAAKTDWVGSQQGRTPSEYVQMLTDVPEGMKLSPVLSREQIVEAYLTGCQSSFIDKGTMTCSFDSESFVQLLELAGSLPSADDTSQFGRDEWEEYWSEIEYDYDYEHDHTLLCFQSISRPITYHDMRAYPFKSADITLVGYPDTSGGNGGKYRMNYTLALTSRSAMAAPVWEFLMTGLSAQGQSRVCPDSWDDRENSLPILKSALDGCLKAAQNGAMRPNNNASETEMNELRSYIEGLRMYADVDSFISTIIIEEAYMFFSGDQTAQKAAEMIQSRASLYLSEQS